MENILTEIKSEHDEVRELLKKIDGYERIHWDTVEELYVTLKAHHDAEEVLFPKVRPLNKTTEEFIDHLEEEHDESEEALLAMIKAHEFNRDKFKEVYSDVIDHMEDEETELFDRSKRALSEEELEEVLDPFEVAEKKAQKKAEKEVESATK